MPHESQTDTQPAGQVQPSRERDPRGGGRPRRRPVRVLGGMLLACVLVVALPLVWVLIASAGRIHGADAVPSDLRAPVAIVLGAKVEPSGEPSPWLRYRLQAAADLYRAGAVDAVLVSGDNGEAHYNEPEAMARYLTQEEELPVQAVALDYAGFDTYATCVRAKRVFGVDRAILVTQDYHAPRAVALCRVAGVDAQAVVDTLARENRETYAAALARELLAEVKAAWDAVSQPEPLLGRRETSVDEAVAWTRAQRG